MDIDLLETFLTAANTGNFRRAALLLHRSEAAVSRQVRGLEQSIGRELFVREAKHIRLSEAGIEFLPHARRVLDAWQAAQESARPQGRGGRLHLAVSAMVAEVYLPRHLATWAKGHPQVDLDLEVLPSADIPAAVSSGRVAVGIGRHLIFLPGLAVGRLWQSRLVLVVGTPTGDHDAALPTAADLLDGGVLFTHSHPGYWDELLVTLRRHGYTPRAVAVRQVAVTRRLVEEGLGASILPRVAVARELAEGRMAEVELPGVPLPADSVFLMVRRGSNPPAVEDWVAGLTRGRPLPLGG
ncbi:MAG: LysR family transcriptional regulator [Sulfobacillus sp.]